jgi:nucleoside-diphosphate-sugar epimerase
LQRLGRLVPNAPFGSDPFLQVAGAERYDLFCHHAADVTNYKSADFDALQALENNTRNLRLVLKTVNCPVLLTGSVFEQEEGTGNRPLRAFSPYGLSKGLTHQFFRYYCQEAGLPLGKFVIPNPFGPFEEPRFTAFLMKNWRDAKPVEVKTPDYLRDNIHVDLLAAVYTQFAVRTAALKTGEAAFNPSGYVEKQGAFAQRVAREVQVRLGWKCELILAKQESFAEPLERANTEPAARLAPDWNEVRAWDAFTTFYTPDL